MISDDMIMVFRRRAPVVADLEGSRRSSIWAIPVAIGIACAAAAVMQTSGAAFSGTTTSPGNSWRAGAVSLTDDASAAALFAVPALAPGHGGSRCITVTYGGSVAAAVRLYVAAVDGTDVAAHLLLRVEDGPAAPSPACAGFTAETTLFDGTLAAMAAAHRGHADGLGDWAPDAAARQRTYRFTYSLDPAAPDALQGATASAAFQWDARST